ncbi:MAG: amino acid adenylation protein, partial [Clostridiaceae bacterium]
MNINVLEWLEITAKKYSDKSAFSDGNSSISFSQVEKYAKSVGSELCKIVDTGKPVAVISGRHPLTPVA